MHCRRNLSLLYFLAVWVLPLSTRTEAQEITHHIDTAAGIRFLPPFPIYQKKTAFQVENLIKDSIAGEWTKSVLYSSAVYSDNSDAFIVVWRQKITELPTRYQFRRLQFFAPLRPAAKVSDVEVFEDRTLATYSLELPKKFKAKVAMLLTKNDNVFVGLYSKNEKDLLGFSTVFSSIEIDPSRRVQWTDLPSGIKPVWTVVILVGGFLLGFIVYLLAANAVGKSRLRRDIRERKSGDFLSPDQHLEASRHIPKGF